MAKFWGIFRPFKMEKYGKKTVAPKERLESRRKKNGSKARTSVKLHRRRFKVISRGCLELMSQ